MYPIAVQIFLDYTHTKLTPFVSQTLWIASVHSIVPFVLQILWIVQTFLMICLWSIHSTGTCVNILKIVPFCFTEAMGCSNTRNCPLGTRFNSVTCQCGKSYRNSIVCVKKKRPLHLPECFGFEFLCSLISKIFIKSERERELSCLVFSTVNMWILFFSHLNINLVHLYIQQYKHAFQCWGWSEL